MLFRYQENTVWANLLFNYVDFNEISTVFREYSQINLTKSIFVDYMLFRPFLKTIFNTVMSYYIYRGVNLIHEFDSKFL